MTDNMKTQVMVDVTTRVWGGVADYLPHKDGRLNVSRNPKIAREQIHDALKTRRKASGNKRLDPLIRNGYANRMLNEAVGDTLGDVTMVKGKRGTVSFYRNWFADKLGWGRRKLVGRIELSKLRRKRRKRII